MLKLIHLELIKIKIGWYVIAAVIANIVIACMLLMSGNDESQPVINSHAVAYSLIDVFTKAVFVIFAAVLITRYIIDEYRSKTISVLFMYPINRKLLITAKLIIISTFTFMSILASDIILSICFELFNSFTHDIKEPLTEEMIIKQLGNYTLSSFEFAGISLIPMFFGMWKKSGSTTIISSVIMVTLLVSNIGYGGLILSSYPLVPFLFAVAGVQVAYSAIHNIEHKDVIC